MPLNGTPEQVRRRLAEALRPAALEFAVVIPTDNEIGNIAPLLHRVETGLDGMEWELIPAIRGISGRDPGVRGRQGLGRRPCQC